MKNETIHFQNQTVQKIIESDNNLIITNFGTESQTSEVSWEKATLKAVFRLRDIMGMDELNQ